MKDTEIEVTWAHTVEVAKTRVGLDPNVGARGGGQSAGSADLRRVTNTLGDVTDAIVEVTRENVKLQAGSVKLQDSVVNLTR